MLKLTEQQIYDAVVMALQTHDPAVIMEVTEWCDENNATLQQLMDYLVARKFDEAEDEEDEMDKRLILAVANAHALLEKYNENRDEKGRFATIAGHSVSGGDKDHVGFQMLEHHSNDLLDRVPTYHIKEIHHTATEGGKKKLTDDALMAAIAKHTPEHQAFYNDMNNDEFTTPHHKKVHKHGYWEM